MGTRRQLSLRERGCGWTRPWRLPRPFSAVRLGALTQPLWAACPLLGTGVLLPRAAWAWPPPPPQAMQAVGIQHRCHSCPIPRLVSRVMEFLIELLSVGRGREPDSQISDSHSSPSKDTEIKTSVPVGPGWEAGVQRPWEVGSEQGDRDQRVLVAAEVQGRLGFRQYQAPRAQPGPRTAPGPGRRAELGRDRAWRRAP